jgi:CDP-glucose 4,6-dehydratase
MLAEKLLAQDARFASSYNFGPSDEEIWPVERIATKLADMWGEGASWVTDRDPSEHEYHVLRLCKQGQARAGMEAEFGNRSGAAMDSRMVSCLEAGG